MLVELLPWLRWLHLVAAAIWTGGLIVLAALVVALRKAGADRELLRATARQFARLSWVAMCIAVVTGLTQAEIMGFSWASGRLQIKAGLVALSIIVALVHQLTARNSSPAARGIIQLVIMLLALAIFGAAVAL